jgi:benzoyl-CoA-dihydrodiol lyase
VALLGVLPGTGGLTRLVDKRKVRRDRADLFSTLGEGVKGRRAKE